MKFKLPESLIVGAVMTFILLPVRLIFYNFVSQNWIGSFGLITTISVVMVVLVKKRKLGRFGEMFERQMIKAQKAKRKYIVYGFSIFNILLLTGFILATNTGNTIFLKEKNALLYGIKDSHNGNMITVQDSLNAYKNIPAFEIVKSLITVMKIAIFQPDVFAGFIAIMNDMSNGYYLHFGTVFLVQQLENLGILLFYRKIFMNGVVTK